MSHFLLTSALLWSVPPTTADIDAAAAKALQQWQTPGLALVVVRDDKVVHLKGYGVSSLTEKTPVSPDTIFPLASCTKPLTTTLLAMLVDDGKIAWNDPVRKHLPDFRLKDPFASERATLRDLLCHRTGLGSHQMLWYRSPLTLDERVRKLAFLDPIADFRTEFHYQTVAFGAAGLAGQRAAGKPWAELIEQRVLRPLGMTSSSAAEPANGKEMAEPYHRDKDGVIRPIPRYSLTQPDPAGTIHSTARDLAAFLRLQLADGVYDGKRLVSAANIQETRRPQVVVPFDGFAKTLNPETTQISYGLGWIVQDYRGRNMVLHGGAIDGFRSHLVLLPDAKLGIAIVSNLDSSLCNFALAHTLVDLFLEAPPRVWNDELLALERLERKFDDVRTTRLWGKSDRAPSSRKLADYEGDFVDDAYGECTIAVNGSDLELRWGKVAAKLKHYDRDTFVADDRPFHDAPFEFAAGPDGRVNAVRFLDRRFDRKPKTK